MPAVYVGTVTRTEDCYAFLKIGAAANTISVALSSLLMYFRIHAVYCHSPLVKTGFAVMWLGVVGASIPESVYAQGTLIAGQCVPTGIQSYGASGLAASTIFDGLVFVGVSYRLLTFHSLSQSWLDRLKDFFLGNGLHKTSKILLQNGQLYFAYVRLCIFLAIGLYLKTEQQWV